jgi:hypothetical protein
MTFNTYQNNNVSIICHYNVALLCDPPFIVTWNMAVYCIENTPSPRNSMGCSDQDGNKNKKWCSVGTAIGAEKWIWWFVWKRKMPRKVFIHYLPTMSVSKTVALIC